MISIDIHARLRPPSGDAAQQAAVYLGHASLYRILARRHEPGAMAAMPVPRLQRSVESVSISSRRA